MDITGFIAKVYSAYINFVFKTSKVIKNGDFELLVKQNKEKYIFVFWHGDSLSFYPIAQKALYILTTRDRRGDYITHMAKNFNYKAIRVPDKSDDGVLLFEIHRIIKNKYDLALTLDGPLGPYHKPKIFPFLLALLFDRRIVPLSVLVKRKIKLSGRWDKFVIPLPFNIIHYRLHKPLAVSSDDKKDDFLRVRNAAKEVLEEAEKKEQKD